MANRSPRDGITYDQVATEAVAMTEQGIIPTIRNIKAKIGGSPNTIHKYLNVWKTTRPLNEDKLSIIPATLVNVIVSEMSRAVEEGRKDLEDKFLKCQEEINELAKESEIIEFQLDKLKEQNNVLTAENFTLTGKNEEQTNEITRLSEELDRARNAAEQVRLNISKSQSRIDSLLEKLDEKSAIVESMKIAHENELKRLTDIVTTETQDRIVAQKNAAVLQSQLDSAIDKIEELKARESRLISEVEKERQAVEQIRIDEKLMIVKIESKKNKISEQLSLIENLKSQLDMKTKRGRKKTIPDLQLDTMRNLL